MSQKPIDHETAWGEPEDDAMARMIHNVCDQCDNFNSDDFECMLDRDECAVFQQALEESIDE